MEELLSVQALQGSPKKLGAVGGNQSYTNYGHSVGKGEVEVGEQISNAFHTNDHLSASKHHLLASLFNMHLSQRYMLP